ncbi:MAG: sugar kinase [Candidatus Nealsonbacteria bacterium]|nr:sugar kinase [Candidatus Nealsonbacteria bacterium]
MMRVCPPGVLRIRQALPGAMECTFGGGEANVCASLALLGRPTRYLTALPKHAVADALIATLRGLGIDTGQILRCDSGRLGLYFLEAGANQRSANVIYDRDHTAVSLAGPEQYDFDAALKNVTRLHVTGITPALSENAFRATLELVRTAAAREVSVSCDLNFRKKLWRWQPGTDPQTLAARCMSEILPHVDLVIGNEEDADKVLGIRAKGTSVEQGRIDPAAYGAVARQVHGRFPNVTRVAITLRESISASHNNWGAMLLDARANKTFFAPLDEQGDYHPYEIRDIVDRVGAGDSFAAGLIYALDSQDHADLASALSFATAASCLKHSIPGDVNYATLNEIRALAAGQASGRVQR